MNKFVHYRYNFKIIFKFNLKLIFDSQYCLQNYINLIFY